MPLYPCTTDSCTSESCAIDSIVYPPEVTERELRKKRSPQETAQDVGGAWGAVTGGACFGAGALAVGAALPTLIWGGLATVSVSYICGRTSAASLQQDWIKDNGAISGIVGGLAGVPIGLGGTVVAALVRKDNKTGKWTRTEKNGDVVEGTWDHTPKAPIDSLEETWQKACVGAALVGSVGYGAGQGANKIVHFVQEVSFGDVANDAAKKVGSAVGEIVADQAEKVIDRANNKLKPLAENMSGQVDKAVAMADKGKETAASCGTVAIFSFLTVLASILLAVLLRS